MSIIKAVLLIFIIYSDLSMHSNFFVLIQIIMVKMFSNSYMMMMRMYLMAVTLGKISASDPVWIEAVKSHGHFFTSNHGI